MGCAALKTPFSRLSCSSQGSHFKQKESVHKTPFWENSEILASTASIFTQILAHKPPKMEIFSSQAPKFGHFQLTSPPFQRQMSVRKPHTLEIRAAHPYLKKSWVPPDPPDNFSQKFRTRICNISVLYVSFVKAMSTQQSSSASLKTQKNFVKTRTLWWSRFCYCSICTLTSANC